MAVSQSERQRRAPAAEVLATSDGARTGRQRLVAVRRHSAALGAASCCVVPFALFMLGSAGRGSAT